MNYFGAVWLSERLRDESSVKRAQLHRASLIVKHSDISDTAVLGQVHTGRELPCVAVQVCGRCISDDSATLLFRDACSVRLSQCRHDVINSARMRLTSERAQNELIVSEMDTTKTHIETLHVPSFGFLPRTE